MNPTSIDSLFLSDHKLRLAKQQIEKMAYEKWQAAGCPEDDPAKYWKQAELEWIEYQYVPDRDLCATHS